MADEAARIELAEHLAWAPRLVAMSRSGRFVVIRKREGLELQDALGTSPLVLLRGPAADDFACVGTQLWVVRKQRLERFALDSGRRIDTQVCLQGRGRLLGVGSEAAVWSGDQPLLLHATGQQLHCESLSGEIPPDGTAFPLGGRRLLIAEPGRLMVRDLGRDEPVGTLAAEGRPLAVEPLFGGHAIAVLMRSESGDGFLVLRANAALVHRIGVPSMSAVAIAAVRGIAVLADKHRVVSLSLRYGHVLDECTSQLPVEQLVVDAEGKYVLMAGHCRSRDGARLSTVHAPYTELFGATLGGGPEAERAAPADAASLASPFDAPAEAADAAPPAESVVAKSPLEHLRADEPSVEPVVVPDLIPLALGVPRRRPALQPHGSADAHHHVMQELDAMLQLVAASAALAVAKGWNSGRLTHPINDGFPREHEVYALSGRAGRHAHLQLQDAQEHYDEAKLPLARRAAISRQHGSPQPLEELAEEFGLSETAKMALLLAAAPALRGDLARLYAVLSDDISRPICDRYLLELLLSNEPAHTRVMVAKELAPNAPLLRHGLLRVEPVASDGYMFAAISVDETVLERMRGDQSAAIGGATELRAASRSIGELIVPDALKRELLLELAASCPGHSVRVVIAGRRGSGRRSLLAALAARVGKLLAVIECQRLPRGSAAFVAALERELQRAAMRNALPCVSGLEVAAVADGIDGDLRAMFRAFPLPIAFRSGPKHELPLDGGYLRCELPPLREQQRIDVWRDALARHALIADHEQLAARYRIGPGSIESLAARGAAQCAGLAEPPGDATALLDRAARQDVGTQIGSVATRVTRLSEWAQVALPADVVDSIREFIGRIRHRRTVYERWGFDAKMTTSRGLTALFYGPPGTGKSMVAGLIARELGLELYRVDLARITSKWIGETEKNLAKVFDAAEDGQVMILFDEADSLFGKRTEVKTSVDRYANLEVNYLLQRFDTFEGIAVLTTNLEGSIDLAFKRRMSLRLSFPFPDEETRVRLWKAHLPAQLPIAGELEIEELAERFPLSGGYIRNSALRAAFLAAQENKPLCHDHLLRAIQLEYRELGKLAPGGRME